MSFKTQADVWRYLLEAEDRWVSYGAGIVVGLKEGMLWDLRENTMSSYRFSNPEEWSPYEEPALPKKLYAYEYLLTPGMICHFKLEKPDLSDACGYVRAPEYDIEYKQGDE